MIVKAHGHYHDGFVWIDNVEKVQDFGFLLGDDMKPAEFGSLGDLSAAVAKTWGDDRSFADELWPLWPGSDGPNGTPGSAPPIAARMICAKRRDGESVLIVAANANPVYLLSDSGDTVDRL